MKLLELNDKSELEITPEALSIQCFENIWLWDKDKNKIKARKLLSAIYFIVSKSSRNPYNDIVDKELRTKNIEKSLGLKFDELPVEVRNSFIEAIKVYAELNKTIYNTLLESMEQSIQKMSDYFKSVDFSERDEKGQTVHSPAVMVRTAKDIPYLIETIKKLRYQVEAELEGNHSSVRGGGQLGLFEEGGIDDDD